jgi:hypothetical protein
MTASKDKARSRHAKRKPKTPAVVTLYRSVYGAPPPRRIRLAVPGGSGAFPQPRDGATAEGWHCQAFVAGATYGLELPYPYPHECRVHREKSGVRFEADFSPMTHPFGVFAAGHYSMAHRAGSSSAAGVRVAVGTASALLHGPERRGAAGLASPVFRGVQGAADGVGTCLQAGRAVRADAGGTHRFAVPRRADGRVPGGGPRQTGTSDVSARPPPSQAPLAIRPWQLV